MRTKGPCEICELEEDGKRVFKRYKRKVRCYKCFRKKEKKEKLAKIEKAKKRKKKTKKYKKSQWSKLSKKCWKMMSEVVRRTGADWRGYNRCYTCGTIKQWKELQAGHRYHGVLDFDYRNIKPQCIKCNHHSSGNLGEYERLIVKEHGIEYSEQLHRDARQFKSYSLEELRIIGAALVDSLDEIKRGE